MQLGNTPNLARSGEMTHPDLDAFIFILIALLTFGGVFDVSLVADYVVSSHRSMRIALNSVAC